MVLLTLGSVEACLMRNKNGCKMRRLPLLIHSAYIEILVSTQLLGLFYPPVKESNYLSLKGLMKHNQCL